MTKYDKAEWLRDAPDPTAPPIIIAEPEPTEPTILDIFYIYQNDVHDPQTAAILTLADVLGRTPLQDILDMLQAENLQVSVTKEAKPRKK